MDTESILLMFILINIRAPYVFQGTGKNKAPPKPHQKLSQSFPNLRHSVTHPPESFGDLSGKLQKTILWWDKNVQTWSFFPEIIAVDCVW